MCENPTENNVCNHALNKCYGALSHVATVNARSWVQIQSKDKQRYHTLDFTLVLSRPKKSHNGAFAFRLNNVKKTFILQAMQPKSSHINKADNNMSWRSLFHSEAPSFIT